LSSERTEQQAQQYKTCESSGFRREVADRCVLRSSTT